jgi:hypothetical protein
VGGGREPVTIVIERSSAENFERLLPLIAAYQQFYGADVDEEKNGRFFRQFIDDDSRAIQYVALESGDAVGFATVYFVLESTRAEEVALLNDLYVMPDLRGVADIAGKLIWEAFKDAFLTKGCRMGYGETAYDNELAQSVYDRMLKELADGAPFPLKTSKTLWYQYAVARVDEPASDASD